MTRIESPAPGDINAPSQPYVHVLAPKVGQLSEKEFAMGMRRRARRRGLVAGAVVGGAIAHHQGKEQQYDEAPVGSEVQYAPPPADPVDQIEHLAQLHASGALSDAEFAAAKAQVLGT
jgi:predicted deacylase